MKLPQTCDYVVVGGGLTGLITFKNLLAQGKDVILIEKSGKIGGSSFEFNIEDKTTNIRSYIWTTQKLNEIFNYEKENSVEVLTVGKKGLTPFMGFGDSKVQALEFYNSFTENQSFKAKSFKENFISEVDTKRIFTHTEITKLLTSEENGRVEEVEMQINGKKTLKAKEIYWTGTANDFDRILPLSQYGKFRQKVKKAKSFDCLSVSFELEQTEEVKPGRYIFFQDENTPWIGEVFESTPTVYWTAYVDQNESADHDTIRKQIKFLKRFLAKAFKKVSENEEEVEGSETEKTDLKQKNIWSNERITIHKSALSQLNISEKDDMMKILPNIKFLGSAKKFWPHPFEAKVSLTPAVKEEISTQEAQA